MKHPCKAACTNRDEPSAICEFGEANKIWVFAYGEPFGVHPNVNEC